MQKTAEVKRGCADEGERDEEEGEILFLARMLQLGNASERKRRSLKYAAQRT